MSKFLEYLDLANLRTEKEMSPTQNTGNCFPATQETDLAGNICSKREAVQDQYKSAET
jgi:hypothetical protein